MIAYLRGTPLIQGEQLIIITHGVGYGVAVGGRTMTTLATQSEAEVFIHTFVREDALDLYGFCTIQEKELFTLLLSVSGVGPRIALALVDIGVDRIIEAVQQANVGLFSAVPRVGKKLSQKIIIDLKPKLGSLQELNLGPRSGKEQDVMDALSALGFSESEVHRTLLQLDFSIDEEVSALVKQAIKLMTNHNK